jgi:hypothetical protein
MPSFVAEPEFRAYWEEIARSIDVAYLSGSSWNLSFTEDGRTLATRVASEPPPCDVDIKIEDLQDGWKLVDGKLFRI